ncbi:MAG: signal peptidase I, partial [Fidelibacterota bacterium]
MAEHKTIARIIREIKSLFFIILIALSLRATVIEAYIVPTGSMEDTIMTGDFLIGNKFVYGMRTPDWIGIPYTELGLSIPWIRFPEFRDPHPGDVVIFKYPRDTFQKYVKRCVAGPGQTITAQGKKLFVDGEEFRLPSQGKFVDDHVFPSSYTQPGMFLRENGNRDSFGPIRVPQEGDTLRITS